MGGSSGEVSRHLKRFVDTGLAAVYDGRHYLSELGMRRAANMSRVLPSIIRSRHGVYLDRWYREYEEHHNDGVNRLVVRFAREGVLAVAGWRGEVNVPGLTQVRPDLLVQVNAGMLGAGTHYIEFERRAVSPQVVEYKLGPYRRMAAAGRPLPLLMVCETARGRQNFRAAAGTLPMLTTTLALALAGPVTGAGYGVEPGRGPGGAPLPVTKQLPRSVPLRRGALTGGRPGSPRQAYKSLRHAGVGGFSIAPAGGIPRATGCENQALVARCQAFTRAGPPRRLRPGLPLPRRLPFRHPIADAGLGELVGAGEVAGAVATYSAEVLHVGSARQALPAP